MLVGNSSIYKGMVPDAKVRVCYSRIMCNSTIPSEECADDLLEILMRPIDDKVDVLAIPMGVSKPFPDTPVALVLSRIAKDIPVVASVPNMGCQGLYSGSAIISADNVIAVGSYEITDMITWTATVADSTVEQLSVTYTTPLGWVLETNYTYDSDDHDDICVWEPNQKSGTGKFVIKRVSPDCDVHAGSAKRSRTRTQPFTRYVRA